VIFVDASAIVAVICGEDRSEDIAACLITKTDFITSPMAIYEAALAVARLTGSAIALAQSDVAELLSHALIMSVPIVPTDVDLALAAYSRFGKGRHAAKLNMGDCFAYAVAKSNDAAILFVGDDFIHTDLKSALDAN
jgi:ribonuclease VapC